MNIYKVLILSYLRDHPDIAAFQVFDWIKERDKVFKIGESTISRKCFVLENLVRERIGYYPAKLTDS